MPRTFLFPGSFDPMHSGHIFLIKEALKQPGSRVLVAVCGNPTKQDTYTLLGQEAASLAQYSMEREGIPKSKVRVIYSTHSVVTIALDFGVDCILRGCRTEEERKREWKAFKEIGDLLPSWVYPAFISSEYSDLEDVSSTKIKGQIRELILPVDGIPCAVESFLDRRLNGQTLVLLGGEEEVVNKLLEKVTRGSPKAFRLESKFEEVLSANTPGARRLKRFVEKSVGNPFKMVQTPEEILHQQEEVAVIGKYMQQNLRKFRKQLHRTTGLIFLVGPITERTVESARGLVVVAGNEDKTRDLAELANKTTAKLGCGQVIRFAVSPDDSKFSNAAAQLLTDLYNCLEMSDRFVRSQNVFSHGEALEGGLWSDMY